MAALGGLFVLLALISLVAVIKPFGPYKKRWHAFIGFLVLLVVGGALAPSSPDTSNTSNTAVGSAGSGNSSAPADSSVTEVSKEEPPAPPRSRWRYSNQRDEMRNGVTSIACLESTNELEFDFPYQGGSTATICFRQSPQYGFDAWVSVERGQFTCLMDCTVRVKFDDGEIHTFSAGGASDGSADIVFISNANRFLNGVKGAGRIVVEAEFYQSGAHQMVFENAEGLQWPPES
jgi:hypothetical protein